MAGQVPQTRPARPSGRVGREPRRGVLSVRGERRRRNDHTQRVLRGHAVQRRGRPPHGQAGRLSPEPAHQPGLFAGRLFRLYRATVLDHRLGQGRVRRLRKIPEHPQGECLH